MSRATWSDIAADLLLAEQAARALPGIRDPLITAQTRDALRQLLGFRHVFRNQYGGFVFALAEPKIALADATMPRLSTEMAGAAQALRFLDR